MNTDNKKILYLIHADLITMNGGKNNMRMIAVLMLVFFGGLGMISPLIGLCAPLLMSEFFVPMIFNNEVKYHSEKMCVILPVSRRELVQARFAMSVGLYVIVCFVFYLLMMLSTKLKLCYLLFDEVADNTDIIKIIALTDMGLFNLLFFAVFSFGLLFMASSLRKYFKDNKSFVTELTIGSSRKKTKKTRAASVLIPAAIVLAALIIFGVLPIGPAGIVITQLIIQLSEAANGFLLGTVLLTIALFSVVYQYICTVLEYGEKEL